MKTNVVSGAAIAAAAVALAIGGLAATHCRLHEGSRPRNLAMDAGSRGNPTTVSLHDRNIPS
jgi:hypothetical protein